MPLPVGVWMLVVVTVMGPLQVAILMPSAGLLVDVTVVRTRPAVTALRLSAGPPVALIVPLVEFTVPLVVATNPEPAPVVSLSAPKLTVEVPLLTRLMPMPAAVLLTVVVPKLRVEVPKVL